MSTTTELARELRASRWLAWCDTCQADTESDDTTCRWCITCGDRRDTE